MKFLIIPIFIVPIFLFGQTPINDPNWQLLWSDEFTSQNNTIWEYTNNYDHYGEDQVYLSSNVGFENGNAVITFKQESYDCPTVAEWACHSYQYDFQSGCFQTWPAYNLKYGYLEARIKNPYGVGLWPAFWMFGEDPTKPESDYEEIDIYEMSAGRPEACPTAYGYNGITHNQNHLLTGLPPYGVSYQQDYCHDNIGVALVNDYTYYHKYAMEWTPDKFIWYVDDNIVRISPNIGLDHFEKIIFNIAKSNYVSMAPNVVLPAKMYIDYLRVYKPINDCGTNINACSYNFNNPSNLGVKGSVIIGGNGCVNSVPLNSTKVIRASTSIEIKGDFTVPLGSSLYLDVNSCY